VTGIVINHWGTGLPGDLRFYLGAIHRLFTLGLVAAPLIWFAFDRHHFRLAAKYSLHWTSADMLWARDTARWIASWGRHGAVRRGAFNPGQRFWYIYVPSALAVFAVTGAIKWLGPGVAGDAAVGLATVIHVGLALATDLLLLLHVYLKLVLPVLRDSVRGARQYIEGRDRQRATAPAREG
ncbi:MAG TPA: hypothetical protein VF960_12990, partial [Chloroflexota bacterium]